MKIQTLRRKIDECSDSELIEMGFRGSNHPILFRGETFDLLEKLSSTQWKLDENLESELREAIDFVKQGHTWKENRKGYCETYLNKHVRKIVGTEGENKSLYYSLSKESNYPSLQYIPMAEDIPILRDSALTKKGDTQLKGLFRRINEKCDSALIVHAPSGKKAAMVFANLIDDFILKYKVPTVIPYNLANVYNNREKPDFVFYSPKGKRNCWSDNHNK